MNRRRAAMAVLGLLFLLGLAAGAGVPASGNEPVGSEGYTLDVDPSDNLPDTATVIVTGTGFVPMISIPADVTVLQCAPSLGACGPGTPFTPDGAGGFTGPFNVFRSLVMSDMAVDCFEIACEVRASGFSAVVSHPMTFSGLAPTTTTIGRGTTTTTTTTKAPAPTTTIRPVGASTTVPAPTTTRDLRRQPGVTIPPTTRVTVAPTTTTAAPTTTTTVPPTTTTTAPPAPVSDGPSLIAVTPKNESSGPPGGGLRVTGSGYQCETVYFFFDGVRVGSGSPDAAGRVSRSGLSVPGDAGRGTHQVTASCDAGGDLVVQTSMFEVLPVSVHRPAFVTSLPLPSQVSLDPAALALSAAIAAGAIMLIAFPYELFNSTMEENYDEVRSWFGLGPRGVPEPKTHSRALSFFLLTAVAAVACGFLSPDFGFSTTGLVLFIGIFVAMLVMAVLFSLPADIGIRRQFGEWGKLNFLPGTVLVSIVLVLLSRLLDFQPGYFYGALAGLAFRSALSEKVQGKMTAANWLFSLIISVGAFFLRAPVSATAAEPGSSIWWIGLEICLAMIFLWGVEGLAVAMLPMRFLDGRKVLRWSKPAWAVLFFLGIFATVHVLLRPGSGYVGETDAVSVGVLALFALFGVVSVALWAYFRFRPQRWAPVRA
jgi:hypothetical protein